MPSSRYDPLPGSIPPDSKNIEQYPVTKPAPGQLPNRNPTSPSRTVLIPKNDPSSSNSQPAFPLPKHPIGSIEPDEGGRKFASLIHQKHLSDREKILVDALNKYKNIGFKRVIAKYLLLLILCICGIMFTIYSIGCWSAHLELIEHLEVYDERYMKKHQRSKNASSVDMDCPIIGVIDKFWTPNSSYVDLFGKILSIISIRKIFHLVPKLYKAIKLRTVPQDEALNKIDETQKDLHGLAESFLETICE
ncbi:unnamed protein product [Caenorhabditis angaria]|uniref:Uncharacterized protein n=1 Tax=Caenorhabditis angaria TaxID=860376 RepID=A0A9P1N2R8_9PELO|nr:unnamed protein product [Caenorhabditis angaria]